MENKYICNCKKFDFSSKNFVYWENRETTSDEFDVINFMKAKIDFKNKVLLHLGIGNSKIAQTFRDTKKLLV